MWISGQLQVRLDPEKIIGAGPFGVRGAAVSRVCVCESISWVKKENKGDA